jgi:hypothetical protein
MRRMLVASGVMRNGYFVPAIKQTQCGTSANAGPVLFAYFYVRLLPAHRG